jgi:hypothetical protein
LELGWNSPQLSSPQEPKFQPPSLTDPPLNRHKTVPIFIFSMYV